MSMNVASTSNYMNSNRSNSETGLMSGSNDRGVVKKYKILAAIFALTTLVLIITVAVVASKKTSSTSDDTPKADTTTTTAPPPVPKVCMRPECRDAAAFYLTTMNTDADPCNDFFDFVCGKWVNETEIPKEKSKFGVFDYLSDDLAETCIEALQDPVAPDEPKDAKNNARAFFQACVQTENVDKEEGVSQLKVVLQNVGISSNITSDDPTDFNIYTVLSNITNMYGLNPIINFGVGPDDNDTIHNIIVLDQPESFGLPRNFLLGNTTDQVTAYKTYIRESLCLFSENLDPKCSHLDNIVEDIFNFEVDVAKLTRDLVERRSASTWYFKMSFNDLNQNITELNFLDYSKAILGEMAQNVTENTEIIVKEETYLRNLTEYLTKTKNSVKSNYLAWRLVQYFGPLLFKSFRDIKFNFDKVLEGITKPMDIANVCFDKTNEVFGHAVGSLYIEKEFDEHSKQDVEQMVDNLANAFRKLLDENKWMDEHTKEEARLKLKEMEKMIGYPEWTKNDTELNEFYQVSPMKRKDMFYSLTTMLNFIATSSFSNLWVENNRSAEWITPASIVNAFYNPSANTITFPAGILQLPFYGKRPKYLNYGAIGTVIGHEITHGYDDQGSEFNGEGNLRNWWTEETRQKFNDLKQCFIDQYTNIVDAQTGRHLNGSQTIGENIADNGGIRESYQAYVMSGEVTERLPGFESFTDKQMFFISAASVFCTKSRKEGMENSINDDVHAPAQYRTYVPLLNTDEFAEVYNCPKGSTMNPEKRCRIW